MKTITTALALIGALLLPGCYTETAYSREVAAAPQPWFRDGSIVSIREIVHRTEGNPVGGAVAGTVIGGLLGHAFSGGSSAGTFVGAVGGAATGAAASSGSSEQRSYEVTIRFDDGSTGRIVYAAPPAWRTGDRVRQTSRGLEWLGRPAHPPPPQPPPPPAQPPPPPAQASPPPPPAEPPPPPPPQ